jgi:hypothetical protein
MDQRQEHSGAQRADKAPPALRAWFILHFWVDLVFALPLFVAPRWFLGLLGWTAVDPATSRIVAAALFGIGIQSWLGRDEPRSTFRALLTLKVIWSTAATVGLILSALEGGPLAEWGLAAFWAVFCAAWWTWRIRLARSA